MRNPVLLSASILALAATAVQAQTLKPGLWEINNKMGGNPELERAQAKMQQQLAGMAPAQRKQMEAMLAQRGVRMTPGAAGTNVQVCMTREMAERNDVPVRNGCTATRQPRSGNTMHVAFTCSNPASSGEGEFTFTSPEAYRSHMTLHSQEGGRPQTMTMDTTGKWLGADCGSVKPLAPSRK